MSGNDGNQQQQTDDGKGGQQQQGGDGKQEDNKFTPVTFKSQDEFDAAFKERVDRASSSAKAEALKSFEEAGATPEQALEAWKTWKAEEDKKKSPETLEREKRLETERELEKYKQKEARGLLSAEVAKGLKIGDTPIPAELLAGSTKDEMEAHGKSIIAFFNTLTNNSVRSPGFNPLQGHSQEQQPVSGDAIRTFFETGSFQ